MIEARDKKIEQLYNEIEQGKKVFDSLEDLNNQKEEHIDM